MTYEELLPILERNGFYCEELTELNRCLYGYYKYPYIKNTNFCNVIITLIFDNKTPKLLEIQFYTKFYLTKEGVAAANTATTDWADDAFSQEITPEKIDKKCRKVARRIKILAERAKLARIEKDF